MVTGRSWRGTAFGGARGRTDVPKIVDWYMDGKINIDDLITHVMRWKTSTRASTSCTKARAPEALSSFNHRAVRPNRMPRDDWHFIRRQFMKRSKR